MFVGQKALQKKKSDLDTFAIKQQTAAAPIIGQAKLTEARSQAHSHPHPHTDNYTVPSSSVFVQSARTIREYSRLLLS